MWRSTVSLPHDCEHAINGTHDSAYVVFTDQMYVHADPDDWCLLRDEPALHGIL